MSVNDKDSCVVKTEDKGDKIKEVESAVVEIENGNSEKTDVADESSRGRRKDQIVSESKTDLGSQGAQIDNKPSTATKAKELTHDNDNAPAKVTMPASVSGRYSVKNATSVNNGKSQISKSEAAGEVSATEDKTALRTNRSKTEGKDKLQEGRTNKMLTTTTKSTISVKPVATDYHESRNEGRSFTATSSTSSVKRSRSSSPSLSSTKAAGTDSTCLYRIPYGSRTHKVNAGLKNTTKTPSSKLSTLQDISIP